MRIGGLNQVLNRDLLDAVRDKAQGPKVPQTKVRPDFSRALQAQAESKLGKPGSDKRAKMDEIFKPFMTNGKVDLDKLPQEAQAELTKLQKASEDFEAFFIKGLLSKMRSASFVKDDSQMTNFAKDMMDQSIAEASSKGHGSLGIAKTVFLNMGGQIVDKAVGESVRDRITTDTRD